MLIILFLAVISVYQNDFVDVTFALCFLSSFEGEGVDRKVVVLIDLDC